MINYRIFSLIGLSIITTMQGIAQMGMSSASVSMNRSNAIVSSDQVRIEEYVNYHKHNIDIPRRREDVALSMEYSTTPNETFILQVGIATKELLDLSSLPPVNVSLVIDRSGSMQANQKLEHVKEALHNFIKGLRPIDYVSIVTYESGANVTLEPIRVGQIESLEYIINGIYPGGSTNLNAGLMLGYEQVLKNYSSEYTNKVILFTDGIVNTGEVDLEQIVKNSSKYNKKGIDVSTIGLGSNLNYQLLQQIAEQGKGANHFVGEHKEDIDKVFDNELQALLSSIGKDVYLEIEYPQNFSVKQVYGYRPEFKNHSLKVPLENLNNGQTQVVLVELESGHFRRDYPIVAKLHYKSGEYSEKTLINTLQIQSSRSRCLEGEVKKNYYIGKMAFALKQMAVKSEENKPYKALQILNETLYEIDGAFVALQDKDIKRVRDILEKKKSELEPICNHTWYYNFTGE